MDGVNEFLNSSILGIQVRPVAMAIGVILSTIAIREYAAKKVMNILAGFAAKTEVTWDDEVIESLRPPLSLFILLVGVWTAARILHLPEKPFHFHHAADLVAQISIALIIAWTAMRLINIMESELKKKSMNPEYWMDTHLVPVLSIGLKLAFGIGIFVDIAQTLGYSVSALVASLGIGGVAVALAAKDTLANFFGSITVMVDKPFRIGDWVKGDNFDGVVEEIGFRSTRIRTSEKTVKVVPNDKIASMIVENMDRRKDKGINMRRVNFTLGLEYKATAEQMENAVNTLRELLGANNNISEEGRMVFFSDFGESSLNLLISYFIKTTDYQEYLRIRQDVNLAMMRALERLGLAVALPTRTLRIEKDGN